MKRLFLLITMIMAILVYSQEENETNTNEKVITIVKNDEELYDAIEESSTGYCYTDKLQFPKYRNEKRLFYVNNIVKCKNETFISGYYLGKQYFFKYNKDRAFIVDDKRADIETAIQKIKMISNNKEEYVNFVNTAKKESEISLKIALMEHMDEIDKYKKYGLGVIYARPKIDYSISGAEFKIFNASKKTIKYITFNFYANNPVGDKVPYKKGIYFISRKGIGPVEPDSTATWEFDTIWLTDIVDELVTTSIIVQYMDGTTKTIKMNDNMWMDNDLIYKINNLNEMMSELGL